MYRTYLPAPEGSCPFCKPPKKTRSKKKTRTPKQDRKKIAKTAQSRNSSIFSLSPQEALEHATLVAQNT